MKEIPRKDVPDSVISDIKQIGEAVQGILPDGSKFIVVAVVPGEEDPFSLSTESVRFITNLECYGAASHLLTSMAEDLVGRKCPHEFDPNDNDPCFNPYDTKVN